MQASPQLSHLRCLKSIIDFDPLRVNPETSVSDAVFLMANHGVSILVLSGSQVVGWLIPKDVVQLLASGVDLKTTPISEVMQAVEITLKLAEFESMATVLSLLHQHQLDILPVIDDHGQLVGTITPASVCQALAKPAEETQGEYSQTPVERLRLLESAVVNANDAILITAADVLDEPFGPRIVYVNPGFTKMTGYSPGEVIGKTPRILQGELTSRTQLKKMRTALQSGLPIRTEFINYHKDGSTYWVEVNVVPIIDQEGKSTHFVSVQRNISTQKSNEAAIRWNEELFRQVTENIPQVFFVRDAYEEKLYYISPAYEQIWGRSRDRLYENFRENLLDSIHPLDRDHYRGILDGLLSGQNFTAEFPIVRTSGEMRWISAKTFPVNNEKGELYRFAGIAEDITEIKEAQAALTQVNQELEMRVSERTIALTQVNQQLVSEITERHESEERFRFLAESIPQQVWIANANGELEYVNQRVVDYFMCSSAQILGVGWQDGIHPDDLPDTLSGWQQSLRMGTPHEAEFRCLRGSDQTYRWHLIRALPMRDQQGRIVNWFGTNTDIDDRVSTEITLRETQQQLQAILYNSPAVIYVIDPDGKNLLGNRKYEQLLNLTQDQILGKNVHELWPAHIADEFAVNNRQVIADGVAIETEEVVPQEDGLHTYLSIKFPLKDAHGVTYAVGGISTDITQRKLAEESLLRFGKAIESISDAIVIGDITGASIYVNPAFIEQYEYTLEELQVAGGCRVIFEHPAIYEKIRAAVAKHQSWRGEVTFRACSGRLVQVYVRSDAIKDATGKSLGTICIHTDITQRKRTEEGLRLRNRAIAASSNGIIITDASLPNRPIIYVNPAFERLTGYSAAEVIGRNFCSFQGNDLNQSEIEELSATMQAGKDCTVTLRNYRKDGSLLWSELNISPVYDVAGKLTHYITIQTNITERKQAETALLVSQERLQYLLSSSPAVIYTTTTTGSLGSTFISENVTAMTGYEAWEIIENSSFWTTRIHPEDLPDVLAEMAQVVKKPHYSLEYRFLHKDGTYRWLYDKGQLMRDQAGNPLELVGYLADITERKQLEQELKVALETEKELNELKSRFVSMTSHEFRTPLSTILSSSELLEHYRHQWTEAKQLTHLHRIQTAVKRMTEMLNDVLVIGKAEAGKLEYSPKCFDLVEYCRYLLSEAQVNQDAMCVIYFTSQHKSLSCCMDDKLLGHILNNLLSNALKYSRNDSTIEFSLACDNEQAIFQIQDQGIGIPEEDQPRLFESFHRARNVGNILGTGLGLAIVKTCVDLHQGEISVTSTQGIGTVFTVKLPLNNHINTKVTND
ncbi:MULTISPECIES: PAS domain S-box protein [unclassified Nodularia (in: cyanobacteria)]|uniref:PAS domain S-box protein n=1 Tax=unclassified Nodularia (in: cyanobacteria) TaxID=2656917 RepID=UPI001882A76D|nr:MULTISPECIES: PAS domain S-box protein [unclassified Nodularia (in: cyanobacteria)]MBE9200237.1 PAS domain S-box protein [Nodularia sp. LEGE 06071]MCC2693380.1 PAS domain S-box protein [Nodularia sp. LEGE 04288]